MAGDLTGILLVGAIILGGVYLMQNPQILQNLGGGMSMEPPVEEEEAPPEEEPEEEPPMEEEPEPEPEIIREPFAIPVPIIMPSDYGFRYPGYPRQSICKAAFGGSCNSECRNGPTRDCLDCVYFCGLPKFRGYRRPDSPRPRPRYVPPRYIPRPRPRPRPTPSCPRGTRWDRNDGKCVKIYGGPGPSPGVDCPRGKRYDWTKKRCITVPKPPAVPTPTPAPEPEPEPAPAPVEETETPEAPAESAYGYSYYSNGWY